MGDDWSILMISMDSVDLFMDYLHIRIYIYIYILIQRKHGIKATKYVDSNILQQYYAIFGDLYHQQIYSFHPVTNAVIQPVVTNFTRKPALGATISLPANRTCHLYRQFRRKFPRKKAPIA